MKDIETLLNETDEKLAKEFAAFQRVDTLDSYRKDKLRRIETFHTGMSHRSGFMSGLQLSGMFQSPKFSQSGGKEVRSPFSGSGKYRVNHTMESLVRFKLSTPK